MTSVSTRRIQVASLLGCLVGGLTFVAVLLDFRWSPGRTAIELRYASNFFDLQADAFLRGHLDVPENSLGIEGFVVGDRTYMYFPPFPALVRMPVMLVTREFDGRLTVLSMAVAWLVLAVMTARLLWLVRHVLHGQAPVSRREAAAAGILLAAMTGGTVLTFVAALPWVYHEVYAWAIATVIGSLYWLLRATHTPTRRTLGWLLAFALAAVLTRTTGGFAVCGAIALAGGWRWVAARARRPDRTTAALLAVAVLPLVASVTLNLAKFDHPYLFPLQDQIWTEVNEQRRQALEANGGTITGPQFIETTLSTYFRPDGIRFTQWFPFVSLPAEPPPVDAGAVFDQTYRTASVTATTPLLLILALVSLPLALGRRDPLARRLLVPPLVGAAVIGGGVLMYGYIANRYTAEFVPFLIMGSIVTLWVAAPLLARLGRVGSRSLLALLAVLTAYSLVVHTLLGITTSAVTRGGQRLVDHLSTQRTLSGGPDSPQSTLVTTVRTPPPDGPVDTLAHSPTCSALWLATGDRYEPWVLVEEEATVLEVTLDRDIEPGVVRLASVLATTPRDVSLEIRGDHHVRIIVSDEFATLEGQWFGVYPTTSFRVAIAPRPSMGLAEVRSTPGGFVAHVPYLQRDESWHTRPGRVIVDAGAAGRARLLGAGVARAAGQPNQLCHLLAADVAASSP